MNDSVLETYAFTSIPTPWIIYTNRNEMLCYTCIWTFAGVRPWGHHLEYKDFVQSKDDGCFVCIWLWQRHEPPPLIYHKSEMRLGLSFKTNCLIIRGWEYYAQFSIWSSWAPFAELTISLDKQRYSNSSIPRYLRPRDYLDPSIGSNQSLNKIQGWISSCQENHSYCTGCHSGADMFFPARVIDVINADFGTISVKDKEQVVSQDKNEIMNQQVSWSGSTPNQTSTRTYPIYWTLSHRWGDPTKIKQLLRTTESQLREGISLSELSPTFRDAVLLVCRLGYRYIWIDSLCIFQDSTSDWHREVGSLADIYRHSFCNISAISSSYDPEHTGLFNQRTPMVKTLYPFIEDIQLTDQSGNTSNGSWLIRNRSMWDSEIERAPLSRRGWVVQERFLSRRLIHFTRNQIHWECLQCTYCEIEPRVALMVLGRGVQNKTGNWSYAYPKVRLARIRTKSAVSLSQDLDNSEDSLTNKAWRMIVSKFAACDLTKESDKLVAISGIARTFRASTGDTYLAGLWKNELHLHLSWRIGENKSRRIGLDGYAPSWSWASIHRCTVQYMDIGKEYYPLITFVDAKVVTEPPGSDSTGLLRLAELDVNCTLYKFRCPNYTRKIGSCRRTIQILSKDDFFSVLESKATISIFDPRDVDVDEESSVLENKATVYFDLRDVDEEPSAIAVEGTCIPVCERISLNTRHTVILLLQHDSGNRFKRIGITELELGASQVEKWASETACITLI
ncbi:heterokaryon incompatibility protein-domain-containing protein [Annulohypoxylon nitens]|nr:heterokaryon incompatibility protein-domain-containing protein [Annulohypoxylon nitens]